MAYRKRLEESEIASFLIEEDEEIEDGSNSETEDHVREDNVQSDSEDEYIDEVIEESLNDTSTTSENLRHDHRIVIPPQRVIRGKNRYVWATSKGQSSGRTAAINTVALIEVQVVCVETFLNHLDAYNYLLRKKSFKKLFSGPM